MMRSWLDWDIALSCSAISRPCMSAIRGNVKGVDVDVDTG